MSVHEPIAAASAGRRRHAVSLLPVVIGLAAYAMLIFPLRSWLVDDAAISMAYAANWSAGHGLVSQPGVQPVEGYSNFLWVVMLAAANLLGAMTVPGVKLLSFAFVALALLSLNQTCKPIMPFVARVCVLILTATCSSLVSWTTSGLENPLTLLLVCELLRMSYARDTTWRALYFGVLIALLGMTRPEGFLFGAFPLLFLRGRALLLYMATGAVLYLGFLGFRWVTFHDFVPNTFYAKDASALGLGPMIANALILMAGPFGISLVLLAVLAAPRFTGAATKPFGPPLALMTIASGIFILMPPDWMPDRRFGTAFFAPTFVFAGLALSKYPRLMIGLTLVSIVLNGQRLLDFYKDPTVPMTTVQRTSEGFDQAARDLGVRNGSVLLPDIGAALMTSKLRVYDLAGLCDRVIARQLRKDDKRGLHDYFFQTVRPTFIRIHGPWARHANLDGDPRFRRDYVPIRESVDPGLLKTSGVRMMSGDYVRRDTLPRREVPGARPTTASSSR